MISERLFHPRPPAALPRWVFAAILGSLLVAVQLVGMDAVLRYERAAIQSGEWLRLLTGNLVHLGPGHLLLNLAGLLAFTLIDARVLGLQHRVLEMLVLGAGVGLGLFFLQPSLHWYVGFSGALHGLFVLALWPAVRQREPVATMLMLALIGKLGWEHYYGAVPWSQDAMHAPVITAAHSLGAATAMLWLLSRQLLKTTTTRIRS
jgi:rhomboid family GlyGly-CTERM serine protease